MENRSICSKNIKSKILKKVKYTENYFITYEDTIMVFTLFQIANSYYYMKEEGYYYSKDDKNKPLSEKNNNSEWKKKEKEWIQLIIYNF